MRRIFSRHPIRRRKRIRTIKKTCARSTGRTWLFPFLGTLTSRGAQGPSDFSLETFTAAPSQSSCRGSPCGCRSGTGRRPAGHLFPLPGASARASVGSGSSASPRLPHPAPRTRRPSPLLCPWSSRRLARSAPWAARRRTPTPLCPLRGSPAGASSLAVGCLVWRAPSTPHWPTADACNLVSTERSGNAPQDDEVGRDARLVQVFAQKLASTGRDAFSLSLPPSFSRRRETPTRRRARGGRWDGLARGQLGGDLGRDWNGESRTSARPPRGGKMPLPSTDNDPNLPLRKIWKP